MLDAARYGFGTCQDILIMTVSNKQHTKRQKELTYSASQTYLANATIVCASLAATVPPKQSFIERAAHTCMIRLLLFKAFSLTVADAAA